MHVVIGGCGRVGSQLTVNLARHGHTISIIDKKPNAFEKLPPGFEGQTLVGMVFDRETLEQAGIRDAGAFIAVTNGDNSNIVSARVAREHYNVERVVARIYDPRRAEIYQRLGIKTVATVRWASAEIYDVLFHGIEHAELAIGSGDIVLLRVEIGPNLAGALVSSLAEAGTSLVVAVDRMGTPTIPGPDACFQEGDVAHIIVARDAIDSLRAKLDEEQH
jgi:trk system potassium uptake protein TrkA